MQIRFSLQDSLVIVIIYPGKLLQFSFHFIPRGPGKVINQFSMTSKFVFMGN